MQNRFLRIERHRTVFVAAVITTVLAIFEAQALAYLFYDTMAFPEALLYTPYVTSIVAFPFCLFVWDQVRRKSLLHSELEAIANRDRLTGLATRDHFYRRFEEMIGRVGVILLADIDRFKSINDTYGHLAGDAVITAVAQALRENCRADDLVCRFGGEEYLIFLPGLTLSQGEKVSEALRHCVSELRVKAGPETLNVTISIGVAVRTPQADIDIVIGHADAALYDAKRQGRNRTVLSPPAGPASVVAG